MPFEPKLPQLSAEAALYPTRRQYSLTRALDQGNGAIHPSWLMPRGPQPCYICCPEFGLGPCHRVCRAGLWR
jgi:hypothetical protein